MDPLTALASYSSTRRDYSTYIAQGLTFIMYVRRFIVAAIATSAHFILAAAAAAAEFGFFRTCTAAIKR